MVDRDAPRRADLVLAAVAAADRAALVVLALQRDRAAPGGSRAPARAARRGASAAGRRPSPAPGAGAAAAAFASRPRPPPRRRRRRGTRASRGRRRRPARSRAARSARRSAGRSTRASRPRTPRAGAGRSRRGWRSPRARTSRSGTGTRCRWSARSSATARRPRARAGAGGSARMPSSQVPVAALRRSSTRTTRAASCGRHEELHLHLLELARAEDEVAGGDLVAEGLADLGDAERRLLARELRARS